MAKYKVLSVFKNLETNEVYEEGQEIELTAKRAKEIKEGLASYGKPFIEKIDKK